MNQLFKVILTSALLLCMAAPVFAERGGSADSSGPPQVKPVKGDVIAAEQAWGLINEGALLIDVRSPGEFENGHIEGALNIVHTDTDALAEAIGDDHARPVVFYCGTGRRVELARLILEEKGYSGIFNASGYEALLETRP